MITFEQLPETVCRISEDVAFLKRYFEKAVMPPAKPLDTWFDIQEVCNYIPDKPKLPTVYGMVSKGTIPYHKRSKKLYFLKSEIDAWLRDSKRKTRRDIEQEADEAISTKS